MLLNEKSDGGYSLCTQTTYIWLMPHMLQGSTCTSEPQRTLPWPHLLITPVFILHTETAGISTQIQKTDLNSNLQVKSILLYLEGSHSYELSLSQNKVNIYREINAYRTGVVSHFAANLNKP